MGESSYHNDVQIMLFCCGLGCLVLLRHMGKTIEINEQQGAVHATSIRFDQCLVHQLKK